MKITTESPSPQALEMLKALQEAVSNSLERKQKLGQYAVVWQDGRPVLIGDVTKKAGI
jgi:hypothetical protein